MEWATKNVHMAQPLESKTAPPPELSHAERVLLYSSTSRAEAELRDEVHCERARVEALTSQVSSLSEEAAAMRAAHRETSVALEGAETARVQAELARVVAEARAQAENRAHQARVAHSGAPSETGQLALDAAEAKSAAEAAIARENMTRCELDSERAHWSRRMEELEKGAGQLREGNSQLISQLRVASTDRSNALVQLQQAEGRHGSTVDALRAELSQERARKEALEPELVEVSTRHGPNGVPHS